MRVVSFCDSFGGTHSRMTTDTLTPAASIINSLSELRCTCMCVLCMPHWLRYIPWMMISDVIHFVSRHRSRTGYPSNVVHGLSR